MADSAELLAHRKLWRRGARMEWLMAMRRASVMSRIVRIESSYAHATSLFPLSAYSDS